MHTAVPLACFLSVIRPFGVQFEDALLQVAPVDKSKCPAVRDSSDIEFQLYTRYNPISHQELVIGDDERLMASNLDFHAPTVVYFHAFMERPADGSALMVREAYMQRGDTNVIIVDASRLEAGPWYFTAAENTWYIGRFAAKFVDYLVSRGLDLKKTHFVGHSLGAQSAGVAGGYLTTGRVSRITGLDPAMPLFAKLPLEQRLDPSDADFVDVIHTDAGIFGMNQPTGHADFWPNGGISPQPGCELEVVIPQHLLLNKCDRRTHPRGYFTFHLQPVKTKHAKKPSRPANKHRKTQLKTNTDSSQNLKEKETTFFDLKKKESTFHDIKDSILHNTKTQDKTFYEIKENSTNQADSMQEKSDLDTPKARTHQDPEFSDTERKTSTISPKTRTHQDSVFTDTESKISTFSPEARTHQDSVFPDTERKTSTFSPETRTHQDSVFTDTERKISTFSPETRTHQDSVFTDTERKISTFSPEARPHQDSEFSDTERKTSTFYAIKSPDLSQRGAKETFQDINAKSLLDLDATFPDISQTETSHVKKRQKRFLPFFKRSEAAENENLLLKLLEFVSKNRRTIPVFTVMREINTLVKSANGELNHSTKERNNYIGSNPPILPLATYNLELGSDSKVKTFVKRLLGLKVEGDRLTITGK